VQVAGDRSVTVEAGRLKNLALPMSRDATGISR
jgi:hypothetical protein